ncbi:MAG TPA: leucyl aminopeptidase [Bryobacteraceae bacterium]|nr:leucyl aminopeptidase [Bryobacteraceae bacterium]
MLVSLERRPIENVEADALVIVAFEGARPERFAETVGELFDSGEIAGKPLEMTLLHRVTGMQAKRLLVAGAGKRERFNGAEMRKLAGAALRFLKAKSLRQIAFAPPDFDASTISAVIEGAIAGEYEPDRYKTEKNGNKAIERFAVVAGDDPALDDVLQRSRILGESQNFAREMVNEPANRLTPTLMAERARAVAGEFGLECEVLDRERMQQLGMGALLGVAQGSAEPPALIILRYRPENAAHSQPVHLGLVGKGVTFDTGGISIKPSDGMEKMKYDMAGGAAAIAAMRAIAQLKPAVQVTALIPAAENMPGSRAQRPGDIVTALSGKTIEVLNTDAEGRLLLADALAYARQLGCTHLIDAATLTGAIVVALGHVNVGLFGSDDALVERVMNAAQAAGEKMWRMPVEDDYKDYLKSAFADLPNIGGRWGGSITAAMFLKEFADPTPWVHLDIAGTAWLDEGKPFMAKGPTGVAVRTMVRLAMDWR